MFRTANAIRFRFSLLSRLRNIYMDFISAVARKDLLGFILFSATQFKYGFHVLYGYAIKFWFSRMLWLRNLLLVFTFILATHSTHGVHIGFGYTGNLTSFISLLVSCGVSTVPSTRSLDNE